MAKPSSSVQLALAALFTSFALSAAPSPQPPAPDPAVQRLLEQVLQEAAAASPELAQARAAVSAERARIPQAGALPDPSLTLGIQNDGFRRINVGTMDTSFLNIMVNQPLFWPGKRGLREQVATLDVRRAEARLQREELLLEGRVRRALLSLRLVQGQLELQTEQEQLWSQAEEAARSRYQTGQAPQSELLRAQLERARQGPRRWALESSVATGLAEVNRLRARPLDEPLPALALNAKGARLADTPDPAVLPAEEAEADAEARSPELLLSTLGVEQADRRVELANQERRPDFSVTAAVMPRGGLEPMWSLGLTVGLPIFSARKQGQAVLEGEQRRTGEEQAGLVVRQLVRLRARTRLLALAAVNRMNQQYRSQILVLSAATLQSVFAQYRVGQQPFAAALEALSGYTNDRASFLSSVAEAQAIAIAQREVSLEPQPAIGVGGGANGAMPGASAAAASSPSEAAPSTSPGAAPSAPNRSPGM